MEVKSNGGSLKIEGLKQIVIPLNRSYFTTFVNSLLNIYYFEDKTMTVESLKNLLFPADHPDQQFNDLVLFIHKIFQEIVRNGKDGETLRKELSGSVLFYLTNLV